MSYPPSLKVSRFRFVCHSGEKIFRYTVRVIFSLFGTRVFFHEPLEIFPTTWRDYHGGWIESAKFYMFETTNICRSRTSLEIAAALTTTVLALFFIFWLVAWKLVHVNVWG